MSHPPSHNTVTVDRSALKALKAELASERETARSLQQELAQEVEVTRKALVETLAARSERDEYRRVLAASVANEKRADTENGGMRLEVEQFEERLRDAVRARGEAEGRAQELERALALAREERDVEVGKIQDRAWADTEAKGRELQRLDHEHGVARGQVIELLGRVPADVPESARTAALRSRLCLASAAFSVLLFLVLFIPFVLVVVAGEESTWPAMTMGLSPWTLAGLEVLLLAAALGLSSWAVRDLRGVERATKEALDAESRSQVTSKAGASSPV